MEHLSEWFQLFLKIGLTIDVVGFAVLMWRYMDSIDTRFFSRAGWLKIIVLTIIMAIGVVSGIVWVMVTWMVK